MATITNTWLGSTFSAVLGNSHAKRALVASLSDSPEIGGSPFQPPWSEFSAIGDVHIPVYIPAPCQRWCAFIGDTLTSPGCTQGRW